MPSGSSDDRGHLATGRQAADGAYGAASFASAVVNTLALQFLTWVILVLAWYVLPVVVLPVVIIDALVAYGLTRGRGAVAQVGRGMLMGCASVPLTLIIFIPAYLIAKAAGLV